MELRFVARQSDYLLVEAEDGSSHRLLIEDQLRDAIRNTQEIKTSGIVPKDVQNKLRSGMSVEEVAAELGVTESAIEPFAAPILDEIRYVLQSALSTKVSDGQSMRMLEDLVRHSQPESKFSAHRSDQGWVISALGSHSYTWTYDPRSKLLEPISEAAKKLGSLHSARDVVTQTVPVRSEPSPSIVREAPPAVEEEPETEQSASVHDLVQELRSRRSSKPEELKPSSAKGRAALPSWDEIVSGAHLDSED
jgi:uncharacterized protein (DUF433 family)